MKKGISIRPTIGIGDALQFSSLPENYFRATGNRLVDISKPWFFDFNPFVLRDQEGQIKTTEMWNFGPKQFDWPVPEDRKTGVYLSNAEIWSMVFDVPCFLNRPRLYKYEDFPFESRKKILFQTYGRSHGTMPRHIVDHVLKKYSATRQLFHIGPGDDIGLPRIKTETLWDLAKVISESRMLIGPDSGPSWIAACYPDVIVKKVRTKPTPEHFKTWTPLEINNIHSHWDSREHMIFNPTDGDIGFTWSYLKL